MTIRDTICKIADSELDETKFLCNVHVGGKDERYETSQKVQRNRPKAEEELED